MNSNAETVYPTPGYSFCFQVYKGGKLHYNWHHHTEYEFLACRSGSGEACIGEVVRSYKGFSAFFIAPKIDHAFTSNSKFSGWIVQIPPAILEFYRGRPEFHFIEELIGSSSPGIGFSEQASKKIAAVLEKAQNKEGFFRWSFILEAFYIASKDKEAGLFSFKPIARKTEDNVLEEIVNRLFDEFAEQHRIKDIASAAGMPVQKFCRRFKKRTGMTVTEYLHSIRLNTAKKLLQQSKLYVDDICYEVGFNSITFFNRKFKEHTGMTPTEYRRSFRLN